jgi:hypothetical protein
MSQTNRFLEEREGSSAQAETRERPVCPGIWFDLPNSVIPTGTDRRKAMICGVEGPCV